MTSLRGPGERNFNAVSHKPKLTGTDARGWEKASLEFNDSLLGFVIEGLIEYG